MEAKELLAQPVVLLYLRSVWCWPQELRQAHLGSFLAKVIFALVVNLFFFLPLVALNMPFLEPKLATSTRSLNNYYFLAHPAVKLGLEFCANLALAVAFTFTPAADLATAPVAYFLLIWVVDGLWLEVMQLVAASSNVNSWLARLAAYLGDSSNLVDATALVFSLAALVAFLSAGDIEDAAAKSLRALAVLLLWFRLYQVLLVTHRFGPYVKMCVLMLLGDVIKSISSCFPWCSLPSLQPGMCSSRGSLPSLAVMLTSSTATS